MASANPRHWNLCKRLRFTPVSGCPDCALIVQEMDIHHQFELCILRLLYLGGYRDGNPRHWNLSINARRLRFTPGIQEVTMSNQRRHKLWERIAGFFITYCLLIGKTLETKLQIGGR